jgi:hypothetical protein
MSTDDHGFVALYYNCEGCENPAACIESESTVVLGCMANILNA